MMGPSCCGGGGENVTLITLTKPLVGFLLTVFSVVVVTVFMGMGTCSGMLVVVCGFLLCFSMVGLKLNLFGLVPVPPLSNSEVLNTFLGSSACSRCVGCSECKFVVVTVLLTLSSLEKGNASFVSSLMSVVFGFVFELILGVFKMLWDEVWLWLGSGIVFLFIFCGLGCLLGETGDIVVCVCGGWEGSMRT